MLNDPWSCTNSILLPIKDGKYLVLPSGELHIKEVGPEDGYKSYQCRTKHRLTGETRLSATKGRLVITGKYPLSIIIGLRILIIQFLNFNVKMFSINLRKSNKNDKLKGIRIRTDIYPRNLQNCIEISCKFEDWW